MKSELFKKAVIEFKQIYFEEFGVKLTDKQAADKAMFLLQLFSALTSTA
ncbi:MAG TPA: hypothetical protein VNW29_01960 [Candidatus Sulfotelmatobacter sp.]|jgi:hypothetical protein|nr:hypothetical protein [Candidatus Sulfotelmatobacter sp.]